MVIGGMTVTEIIVTNKNDVLIAAIQDGGFINRKGYSVILKPSELNPDASVEPSSLQWMLRIAVLRPSKILKPMSYHLTLPRNSLRAVIAELNPLAIILPMSCQ